jgi:hypothetical protein
MRWAELASLLEGIVEAVVMVIQMSLMSLGTARGSQLDDALVGTTFRSLLLFFFLI